MRKESSIAFCAILVFAFLAFSGCAAMAKVACNKTTECAPDEICSQGFCEKPSAPSCRTDNQTCDTVSDCCSGMACQANRCTLMKCLESCDDANSCTRDSCNTTIGQCAHSIIPSCCGNGICEGGESCASCAKDCGCASGEVCAEGACVNEVENELSVIGGNVTIEACRQKALNEWKLKNYDAVIADAEGCAGLMAEPIGELGVLQNTVAANQSQAGKVKAASLTLGSKQEEMYAIKALAEAYKKKKNTDKYLYDDLAYLQDLKGALAHMEQSIYLLYQLKHDSPGEWRNDTQGALFDDYANQYRGVNQEINALYDDIGSYHYKYAFQVDPNDPLVIDIVDEMNGKPTGESMDLRLLKFVYGSVNYVSDPNWKVDWVQPPAYTLMMDQGDCDDSAVLLASLFLRAGISGTELCEVDTDSDGKYDHLTVGVKQSNGLYSIYESTWPPSDYLYYKKGDPVPTEPAPVDEWSYPAKILYCYSPEETVSYALAKKCNDGTEYGKCSVEKPMFCDEKLGLVNDCERCGCDSKYPHCAKVGENKGTCRVCPESGDVWIDEYAVCCPRGYEEYHPEDSSCWER